MQSERCLLLLVTIVTLLPFYFFNSFVPFARACAKLHLYFYISTFLLLNLCPSAFANVCLIAILVLYLCSVPLTMPMNRIRCIFIVLICHLMGQRGYFTPLTDFNAVEGGGFAGRRITLYLCSAIKDSGQSPPLHFSRNHLISKAFFRY